MSANVIASAGIGRMGRGIAITFAYAGFPVNLVDLKSRSINDFAALQESAVSEITATLVMLSEFGLLQSNEITSMLERISFFPLSQSAAALSRADVIFEGVPETLEAKTSALALICEHARNDAILASTTSTILSNELQSLVTNPARFLNAHWLNPAFLVPLVELSPGEQTSPDVTAKLKALLERIGKVAVVCAASPGYIVPRIQALAMNEAARMVEENVASVDDIDKSTRYGFGFRFAVLGLLEFIDWGGGDILYHASRYMASATGDTRHSSPDIIARNMEQGRIGLSTRKGFLDYEGMDVAAYQKERLGAFVALLRHIDKLPFKSGSEQVAGNSLAKTDPRHLVEAYLATMENRDLVAAKSYLSSDFHMTFPGDVTFSSPEELVEWASSRYQSVGKKYERFDACAGSTVSGAESVVYCYGTLSGVWLDGADFSGIRFVDRFTVVDGLIVSQLVWNDLAEVSNFSARNGENIDA